ncbi:hypothetical protein PCASD_23905, partial [Puccinia coronata f. sp. avenae]
PVLVEGILRCARLVGSTGGFGEAPASGCQLGRVTNGQPEPNRVQAGFGHGFVRKTRSWTDPFKQLAGSGQSRAARRAQPPEGSNRVVHSRSCLLAPEKTQVPRRPQGSSAPPPSSTPPTGCPRAARGARGQYDCAWQAPNPLGYLQAARGLNELVSDLGAASLGVVFAQPDRTD